MIRPTTTRPGPEGAGGRNVFFLSIVDVLTHYGVKKAAAKVTIKWKL